MTGLAVAAWPHVAPARVADAYDWHDLDPALADTVRRTFPGSSPGVLALALRLCFGQRRAQ